MTRNTKLRIAPVHGEYQRMLLSLQELRSMLLGNQQYNPNKKIYLQNKLYLTYAVIGQVVISGYVNEAYFLVLFYKRNTKWTPVFI